MEENCYVEPVQKTITAEERQNIETALLTVWGMGCPNCEARIRNSLLSLTGVVNAHVDRIAGVAGVNFNSNMVTIEELITAVSSAGNDGRHEYNARLFSKEVSP